MRVISRSSDDRPAIRAAEAVLLGLDGQKIDSIVIVVDRTAPACVVYGGDPFLLEAARSPSGALVYRETKPYRVG